VTIKIIQPYSCKPRIKFDDLEPGHMYRMHSGPNAAGELHLAVRLPDGTRLAVPITNHGQTQPVMRVSDESSIYFEAVECELRVVR